MAIKTAREIDFSPPPRCPRCNVGVLPFGNHEPLVVDDEGRVYCREHAVEVEPTYPVVLAAYREKVMAMRRAAVGEMERLWAVEEQERQ
jgi:hypothetical protein